MPTTKPKQNERKAMNDKFDELAKSMAQSVTRRSAVKKFGVGLAGIALASFGLANKAEAKTFRCHCNQPNYGCNSPGAPLNCLSICTFKCNSNP
jgi:hypothetical protein